MHGRLLELVLDRVQMCSELSGPFSKGRASVLLKLFPLFYHTHISKVKLIRDFPPTFFFVSHAVSLCCNFTSSCRVEAGCYVPLHSSQGCACSVLVHEWCRLSMCLWRLTCSCCSSASVVLPALLRSSAFAQQWPSCQPCDAGNVYLKCASFTGKKILNPTLTL